MDGVADNFTRNFCLLSLSAFRESDVVSPTARHTQPEATVERWRRHVKTCSMRVRTDCAQYLHATLYFSLSFYGGDVLSILRPGRHQGWQLVLFCYVP